LTLEDIEAATGSQFEGSVLDFCDAINEFVNPIEMNAFRSFAIGRTEINEKDAWESLNLDDVLNGQGIVYQFDDHGAFDMHLNENREIVLTISDIKDYSIIITQEEAAFIIDWIEQHVVSMPLGQFLWVLQEFGILRSGDTTEQIKKKITSEGEVITRSEWRKEYPNEPYPEL